MSQDFEPINAGLCSVDTDHCVPGLTALAESIHAVGGLVSLQLTAGLGRNISVVDPDRLPISASDNPHFPQPDLLCRPLETDEITLIVQRFSAAAARAAAAGIDALDIHGHTGYLIDQFMSPVWNRRTNVYGGSVENRCRFAVEVIQAVKAAAPGLPVSFRLSVDHRFPGGRTAEDSREIALVLERAGLDLMMADDGSYVANGPHREAIDDKGLTATGPDGEVHVDADTVVLAFGVHPAKVGEAINAGFMAALTV